MTEPNFELSFLETSAREADAEGRTLVIDPGYVFEALEKLAEARKAIDEMQTAHESQLTRMAKERARLQRKVDRLEAAQRPPLGYVVVSRNPDTGQMQTHGRVHEKREDAEGWLQWVEQYAVARWRGEVREVR
ncbi:hypothetical protein [Nocardia sp. CY41]|uniref:hypothetical protein n=1 Tax=Nocardia sp. CY41 TaxID=2608686 RepID=UPI00135AEF4F|nr:hypothetical protein [Nocardia sp. CY41]